MRKNKVATANPLPSPERFIPARSGVFCEPMHTLHLPAGKNVYFASDFHLGAPDASRSRAREHTVVRWLEKVRSDAATIFLLGDLFDFWFEYRHVVPKGYVRFLGKLAELTDAGQDVRVFSGNHDMWMRTYFADELNIPVYRAPEVFLINDRRFLIGHGDGLGPGDGSYKRLKRIFAHPLPQYLFGKIHPDLGIGLANRWSRRSRARKGAADLTFLGEAEWLWQYCRDVEARTHHDYYVFGHRHLPLDLPVGNRARYVNLGEWLHGRT